MEKVVVAMIKAVVVKTAAMVKMAEIAEADVTDGKGGSSGRDDDGGIAAGMLVHK
jgi:hypothetical protein